MPPIRHEKRQKLIEQEGRMELAIQAIKNEKVASIREAAQLFDVPRSTLQDRLNGRVHRPIQRANNTKLTAIEEDALEDWILDLDSRGKAPSYMMVKDMANILLAERPRFGKVITVGKNWVYKFVKRRDALKGQFSRRYNTQRALCEDPKIIKEWFHLFATKIAEYGIDDDDIYNFDETGFAMGIASTSKVVTGRDYHGRRKLLQPGNREWITVIECINQNEVLPPTIIFKAKNLMTGWFSTVPRDWRFEVSDNGWTTDAIGLSWLEESFIPHVIKRRRGAYSMLVMDGHGSHLTPQFDSICMANNIITICMPAHSSHLLQPLDVGCFGILKHFYGQHVQNMARMGTTHIDKLDFLDIYPAARIATYKSSVIIGSFAGSGIIPYSPERVLQKLNIRPLTPSPPPSRGSTSSKEFVPHTPYKSVNFRRQGSSIKQLIERRSSDNEAEIQRQLDQLSRGAQSLASKLVMTAANYSRVMAENGRKLRKQALSSVQIPYEGGITVEDMQIRMQLANETNMATPSAPPRAARTTNKRAPQRCGNCREIGHKRNRCPLNDST
jgi:hypothetical protein